VLQVNSISLYVEEHGSGRPVLWDPAGRIRPAESVAHRVAGLTHFVRTAGSLFWAKNVARRHTKRLEEIY
jgi:hypothetical protein